MASWTSPFWVLTEKRKGVETFLTRSRVQEVKVAPSDFHDLLGLGLPSLPNAKKLPRASRPQYILIVGLLTFLAADRRLVTLVPLGQIPVG
jgi:hypothetical protein